LLFLVNLSEVKNNRDYKGLIPTWNTSKILTPKTSSERGHLTPRPCCSFILPSQILLSLHPHPIPSMREMKCHSN